MDFSPSPIRLGFLYDLNTGDDGRAFEAAFELGLADVGAIGTPNTRPIEFIRAHGRGLPIGSEHELRIAFDDLVARGALAIVGPSISDNALMAAPWCDAAEIPGLNYSGGELTRSQWMFHYQLGSLEDEPSLLAARCVELGARRVAVVSDASPIGRRYAEAFDAARTAAGIELAASASISPLADSVVDVVERLHASKPDLLVYLGLGLSSRAVSLARTELGWSAPVLANSALMFGYMRADWRDGFAGWEYVDTVADDNPVRAALDAISPEAAAGPAGCAAFDMGRLVGRAIQRTEHLTRAGLRAGFLRVKWLEAASGHAGTLMGFGNYEHGALKGHYLVLREWADGRSVQVRSGT